MQLEPLGIEEMAATGGATHKVTITHDDLTNASASQTLNLAVTAAEMNARCLYSILKVPFEDLSDTDLISVTFTIDDTASGAAGLMASAQVCRFGTEVGVKTGVAAPASWTTGYTAADTITATVACTAGKQLVDLNKGELWVYLQIGDGRNAA